MGRSRLRGRLGPRRCRDGRASARSRCWRTRDRTRDGRGPRPGTRRPRPDAGSPPSVPTRSRPRARDQERPSDARAMDSTGASVCVLSDVKTHDATHAVDIQRGEATVAVSSFVGALDQPSEIRDGCPVSQEAEHQHRAPGQHLERGFEARSATCGPATSTSSRIRRVGVEASPRSSDRGQRHCGRGPAGSGIADRPAIRVHVCGDLAGETRLADLGRARHEQHPPPPRRTTRHVPRSQRISCSRFTSGVSGSNSAGIPPSGSVVPFECGAEYGARSSRRGLTRDRLDDVHGLLEPFERSRSSFHEGDSVVRSFGRPRRSSA